MEIEFYFQIRFIPLWVQLWGEPMHGLLKKKNKLLEMDR